MAIHCPKDLDKILVAEGASILEVDLEQAKARCDRLAEAHVTRLDVRNIFDGSGVARDAEKNASEIFERRKQVLPYRFCHAWQS